MTQAEGVPVKPDIYTKCAFGIELMELARSFGAKVKTEQDGCEFAEGVSVALAKCRLVLAHPAAASAESIRAEVIEECAKVLDVRAAFWRKQREEAIGRQSSSGKRARREYDYSDLCDARDSECQQRALAIRALSSRATKEV